MHYRLDRKYMIRLIRILVAFICFVMILVIFDESDSSMIGLEKNKERALVKKKVKKKQSFKVLEQNPDVIGMIHIPGSEVYPVLLGSDNYYYLTHNEKKEKTSAGSISADCAYQDTNIRQQFLRHTIIYGHNMKDGSMFHQLVSYKKKKYFKKHPYIEFDNLVMKGKWRVFSVYVIDGNEESIMRKFDNDSEFAEYLTRIKNRSKYAVDIQLNQDSKILTLCTSSEESDNAKTIIHAVLVK
ncbi:sortase, SrtB family [Lachnospiraceae bacterium KM106-2]|nr:sortase, SrtB family [Lachnospiraceae bacterium KM106-2]